jgi:hypothetical protein
MPCVRDRGVPRTTRPRGFPLELEDQYIFGVTTPAPARTAKSSPRARDKERAEGFCAWQKYHTGSGDYAG